MPVIKDKDVSLYDRLSAFGDASKAAAAATAAAAAAADADVDAALLTQDDVAFSWNCQTDYDRDTATETRTCRYSRMQSKVHRHLHKSRLTLLTGLKLMPIHHLCISPLFPYSLQLRFPREKVL